jgi:hypothetical protein
MLLRVCVRTRWKTVASSRPFVNISDSRQLESWGESKSWKYRSVLGSIKFSELDKSACCPWLKKAGIMWAYLSRSILKTIIYSYSDLSPFLVFNARCLYLVEKPHGGIIKPCGIIFYQVCEKCLILYHIKLHGVSSSQ